MDILDEDKKTSIDVRVAKKRSAKVDRLMTKTSLKVDDMKFNIISQEKSLEKHIDRLMFQRSKHRRTEEPNEM